MNSRSIILIVAAVLVAGGTAFMARGLLSNKEPEAVAQAPVEQGKKVLVASANLPAGHIIQEADVSWQKWPSDGVNSAYLVEGQADIATVVGAVIRRGIVAGQPVVEAMVARPGDRGFLAAVLRPNMRAVTISVQKRTGLAGLVFPGDKVDLILLQMLPEIKGPDGEELTGPDSYEPRTAETFLENVRVLAVDTVLNDLESEEGANGNLDTVTLEVTPKQAEMIAAVRDTGDLSLSLRGLAKETKETGPSVAAIGNTPAIGAAAAQDEMPVGTIAAATAAGADPEDPSANMADPFEDTEMPTKGASATYDVEVSNTLQSRIFSTGGSEGVIIVRGASNKAKVSSENVTINVGAP